MRISVVTTGRQDWSYLRPLCSEMMRRSRHTLDLLAGGMACAPDFGQIADTIAQQGFPLTARLEWDVHAPASSQCAEAMPLFQAAFLRNKTEAVLVLGDRFETAAIALVATLLRLPLVHLYGGDETEGAIDNVLRHAITKMSHLHLVAHQVFAERIIQMGEDPNAVHVIGLLSLDRAFSSEIPDRKTLERDLGIELKPPVGLVTMHPTTLNATDQPEEVDAVIAAMDRFPATWIITLPNADPDSASIRRTLTEYGHSRTNVLIAPALGEDRYFGLLACADFVLGNSSSGIIEAPSFKRPSINVGDRQKGRLRSASIIDVQADPEVILQALQKAVSSPFKEEIRSMEPTFGHGEAARKAVELLDKWQVSFPPRKRFISMD
ncbi:UDP-N-acetylglucosamine 2-epimerase (hydrolyzing) [bacterium]|nr:UDP-N-acetylglucosamine 2-epimerase (hydrolyzing) [bacterium]